MGYPEDRTHGADSAIDDEMTSEGDAFHAAMTRDARPPSGMGAIPADMPNATHEAGDAQLHYDLQTFNALVAANTAMQTEISSLNASLGEAQGERDHLKVVIAESLQPAIARLTGNTSAMEQRITQLESEARERKGDLRYERDSKRELQQKLDRALGYLDAVHDAHERIDMPTTQTVRVAPRAVGPDMSGVAVARRGFDQDASFSGYAHTLDTTGSARRY